MKRIIFSLIVVLLIITKQHAFAQFATDKKQPFASIGNFLLENGQQIYDCKSVTAHSENSMQVGPTLWYILPEEEALHL
jgi:hypothetical protein